MLQLELQAIEAKLKIKRLRQAKASREALSTSDVENDGSRSAARPVSTLSKRANGHLGDNERRLPRSKSQPEIKVPLSPPPRRTPVAEPRSPGRVLLGIDKGLTGRDVSLRRPPSARAEQERTLGAQSSKYGSMRPGNHLAPPDGAPRKSFSERMAESRAGEKSRKEREERIKKARSKGFGIDEKEIESLSQSANDDPFIAEARSIGPREFTRDEVIQSYNKPVSGGSGSALRRSNTTSGDLRSTRSTTTATTASSTATTHQSHPSLSSQASSSSLANLPPLPSSRPTSSSPTPSTTSSTPSEFEPFSSLHLSRRLLPHTLLTRTFASKAVLTIPSLLRTVKSPDYLPPDGPSPDNPDFVVLAIIASKSAPKSHANPAREAGGKYMALTLTDLKYSLDLFLFSTAFTRFWKLTPGTLIAILNPSIMPPSASKRDTGRFSLTLGSSDDTVLEIGSARDLGFCASIKRDGKRCSEWVDSRHTEFCLYHVDASLAKTKAGRMEVNSMSAPFAPGGRQGGGIFSGSRRGGGRGGGAQRDRTVPSDVFISSGAAQRLDDNDVDPDAFHAGTSKSERLRRRLAEREREREIARQLGSSGNGAGSLYLRAPFEAEKNGGSGGGGDEDGPEAVDAMSLGLTGAGRAAEGVKLSPIKRRLRGKGGDGDGEAVGWGGAFRPGIKGQVYPAARTTTLAPPLKRQEGVERERGESPARKKTRFITAKGIREAGRESLGVPSGEGAEGADSDDGLEIV